MTSYIQWFIDGLDSLLSPSEVAEVVQCLAIIVPTILTCAGVFGLCWCIAGVFKK